MGGNRPPDRLMGECDSGTQAGVRMGFSIADKAQVFIIIIITLKMALFSSSVRVSQEQCG